MVAHGAGVALAAVALAARAQLGARRARGRAQAAGAGRRERQPGAGGAVERRRLPGVEQVEHGVHVVDVDLARDVGAAEAELARGAQGVREGGGGTDAEARPATVGRGQLGAVPELDREGAVGEGALELRADGGGGGEQAAKVPQRA